MLYIEISPDYLNSIIFKKILYLAEKETAITVFGFFAQPVIPLVKPALYEHYTSAITSAINTASTIAATIAKTNANAIPSF